MKIIIKVILKMIFDDKGNIKIKNCIKYKGYF